MSNRGFWLVSLSALALVLAGLFWPNLPGILQALCLSFPVTAILYASMCRLLTLYNEER